MSRQLDLNGTWQLGWSDGERGDRLERQLAGSARTWDVRVPGEVHESLRQHGVLPEPNVGLNVLAVRWVEETLWFYSRWFTAPKLARGERAWLVFEGLDLAAVIHLNGKEVGRHANYFHPCRVEVTGVLVTGKNRLVVQLDSGLFHTMDRSADGYSVSLPSRLTKRPWLRKTQSSHAWDWSPRLLNVGIHGAVRLEIVRAVRCEQCAVLASVSDDLTAGIVTARVFAEGLERKPVTGTLTVEVKETRQRIQRRVSIQPGMNSLEAVVRVPQPELWWPVGHGRPNRYTVKTILRVSGRVVGTATRRVGFRHVRVNQDQHPERGRYFILEINRKPIFCKGGNFVPADTIFTRVDRRRYATLVARARESNCNFLRVWGGGLYEGDDFYEACDAQGILVWQEFIFACAKYPTTDEKFLADIKREATYQIRRLAHHPSLVAWCGNNEMEWGSWSWGYEKGVAHPDYALFHLVLPGLLRQEDPTRYYQPSSPYSLDGEHPNADHTGDQHPWSVGMADTDFRKYREMICRFSNEGGILGPTALPTVKACLSPDAGRAGSFSWELHDNSVAYWGDNRPFPDTMLEQWLGKSRREMSVEDYVYWAGVVQGAGLAEYAKNFRRRMFDSSSAIFWMYNDCWPCTRSWTIVDYYLRRTPAFWPVRRAFASLIVVVTREGDRVRVYGVNEGPACRAQLRYGLMALKGQYPLDQTTSVQIPANTRTQLAEFDAARWERLGVRTHVAFAVLSVEGREVARDCLILPFFREMQWPRARVNVQLGNGQAIFTSNTFAWRVCLDLDGERALPDNFFDIYPGIPTRLDWPKQLGPLRILRIGNG